MGKRKPVIVGKLNFPTQTEAEQSVRNLVSRYQDGDIVSKEDAAFLGDLLELHPRCSEKVGAGVSSFRIDSNPEYPNRTIFIDRIDGSWTHFSWHKCIKGEAAENLKRQALRNAVMDQIIAFKKASFSPGKRIVCPETGAELSWDSCHVDHCAPRTFDKLIDDWFESQAITLDSVEISPSRDSSFVRALANETQRQSWRTFHDSRKELRLLSPYANLSIAKRK